MHKNLYLQRSHLDVNEQQQQTYEKTTSNEEVAIGCLIFYLLLLILNTMAFDKSVTVLII
jgi:hypothetical protein